jgi:hypothetical protein
VLLSHEHAALRSSGALNCLTTCMAHRQWHTGLCCKSVAMEATGVKEDAHIGGTAANGAEGDLVHKRNGGCRQVLALPHARLELRPVLVLPQIALHCYLHWVKRLQSGALCPQLHEPLQLGATEGILLHMVAQEGGDPRGCSCLQSM